MKLHGLANSGWHSCFEQLMINNHLIITQNDKNCSHLLTRTGQSNYVKRYSLQDASMKETPPKKQHTRYNSSKLQLTGCFR
jgi:hypothetical protein